MRTFKFSSRKGTSFIDLLLSMGILAVLFGGIYLVYFSLIDAVNNIEARSAATALMNEEVETIRNMPYDSIGTINGIPPGNIPQAQTSTYGIYTFLIQTNVRNIDDPSDGTLGGTPNDTAPADYKLITLTSKCISCDKSLPLTITTTVAPKGLESAGTSGSLFVNTLSALGSGVPSANVHVVNASVTPSIDFTDVTNASGVLQLVGVPTSTQAYQIFVSKPGYSSEQTYPPNNVSNPNPVKPNATVAAQSVTNVTFLIDALSPLNVSSSDAFCTPIPNIHFVLDGSKLVGTNPDILKFSTTSLTDAGGSKIYPSLEWDTYYVTFNETSSDLLGSIPLSPFAIDPSSTASFRFITQPAANPALLITVTDGANGANIQNATVTISKGAFSGTKVTGHYTFSETDWSFGAYSSQSEGIDTNFSPGSLMLLINASSTYNTSTEEWLISNTKDLGGSSSTLYSFSWNPTSEPPSTGQNSLRFQLAANNDNSTWNFVGTDGTSNTYFTSSGGALPASLSGKRYFRYKVFMSTQDENTTPTLDDISLDFNSSCVPPTQAFFSNLSTGTYNVDIKAAGYQEATTSAVVSSGSQYLSIPLSR